MTGRRALVAVVGLLAVGPLVSACASGPATPVPTPTQFIDRAELPSCGQVQLGQGEEIPSADLACLQDAGEEGAELAVTRPSTEGDPITEYYRVLPGGGWEAYIDGSRDPNGGIWWFTPCPEAKSLEDLATCQGAPL